MKKKILLCLFLQSLAFSAVHFNNTVRKCDPLDFSKFPYANDDDYYVSNYNSGDGWGYRTYTKKGTDYSVTIHYNVERSTANEGKNCFQNGLWDYCVAKYDWDILDQNKIRKHFRKKGDEFVFHPSFWSNYSGYNAAYVTGVIDVYSVECKHYGPAACYVGSRHCNDTAIIVHESYEDKESFKRLTVDEKPTEDFDSLYDDDISELVLNLDYPTRFGLACSKKYTGASFDGKKEHVKNYQALKTLKNSRSFSKEGFFQLLSYGSSIILNLLKPTQLGQVAGVACEITCTNNKTVRILDNKLGANAFCSFESLNTFFKKTSSDKRIFDDIFVMEKNSKSFDLAAPKVEKVLKESSEPFELLEKEAYLLNTEKELNALYNLDRFDLEFDYVRNAVIKNIDPIEKLFSAIKAEEPIQVPAENTEEYLDFLEDNNLMTSDLDYTIIEQANNTANISDFVANVFDKLKGYSKSSLISNVVRYKERLGQERYDRLSSSLNKTDTAVSSIDKANPSDVVVSEETDLSSSLPADSEETYTEIKVKDNNLNLRINFDKINFDDNKLIAKQNSYIDKLNNTLSDNFDNVVNLFQKFKDEIEKKIDEINNFSFSSLLNKKLESCPMSYDLEVGSEKIHLSYDICKWLSEIKNITYWIFYFLFFIVFLKITFKILLRIF